MDQPSQWWKRLDARREQLELSVAELCKSDKALDGLVSRATYYNWKKDPTLHPQNPKVIDKIADFLGEDAAVLRQEMGVASPPFRSYFEAASAREFSSRLYQSHVRALAHALGMGGSPRYEGVDVLVRLLRDRLSDEPDPITAMVAVLPTTRGSQSQVPYQYQIYIVPVTRQQHEGLLHIATPPSIELLRRKVDRILDGALLPVTREHSTELTVSILQGSADVLLYPRLLDLRAPGWGVSGPADTSEILVTGIYYSGAPDVAALIADARNLGFGTFDHLARLVIAAGLRGLPGKLQDATEAQIARAVLSGESPTTGPTIWSTNNPEVILGESVRDLVMTFTGSVVLLELTEAGLDYAAERLGCVDSNPPQAERIAEWRSDLLRQQNALRELLSRCDERRVIRRVVDIHPDIKRGHNGLYSDSVHLMFDQYQAAARDVLSQLPTAPRP